MRFINKYRKCCPVCQKISVNKTKKCCDNCNAPLIDIENCDYTSSYNKKTNEFRFIIKVK